MKPPESSSPTPDSAGASLPSSENPGNFVHDIVEEDLKVGKNGRASASFMISGVTLGEDPNSLLHTGGTALVIHAKADDLMTDPSGNSGDRIACGVIGK